MLGRTESPTERPTTTVSRPEQSLQRLPGKHLVAPVVRVEAIEHQLGVTPDSYREVDLLDGKLADHLIDAIDAALAGVTHGQNAERNEVLQLLAQE